MGPKKRRVQNNKENIDENQTASIKFDSLSIEPMINENLQLFNEQFQREFQSYEKRIEQKLTSVRQQFDRYLQVHQSQETLARLIDQEINRIQQQQNGNSQEIVNKTNDFVNASVLDSSRTKTYLIGELKRLPIDIENQ